MPHPDRLKPGWKTTEFAGFAAAIAAALLPQTDYVDLSTIEHAASSGAGALLAAWLGGHYIQARAALKSHELTTRRLCPPKNNSD